MADEQLTLLPTGEGYDVSEPGTVVWPLTDHLGTVRDLAVVDAESGTTSVANHRVLDAYGNLVSQTNAAVDCLFAFTGRPLDQVTGLQNNLNRWYDSKVGRWLSEDPIGFEGKGTNTSVYVGNCPTNATDFNGLDFGPWMGHPGYHFDEPPRQEVALKSIEAYGDEFATAAATKLEQMLKASPPKNRVLPTLTDADLHILANEAANVYVEVVKASLEQWPRAAERNGWSLNGTREYWGFPRDEKTISPVCADWCDKIMNDMTNALAGKEVVLADGETRVKLSNVFSVAWARWARVDFRL